jgi:signal transduction histidine kinase/CheY-like chemotaxis protein
MPKPTSWVKLLAGPALVGCLCAILAVLAAYGHVVPNPVLFFSLGIVVSAYLGGFLAGSISLAVTFGFLLLFWSVPGQPFIYTPRDVYRIVVFLLTMPAMVFLVGLLQKNSRLRMRELRKKSRKLGESNRRLQQAERVARTGSWEVDLTDGSLYSSEGARRIYGLDDHQSTLQEIQSIPLRQYRPMLDAALRDLVERGIAYDVVFKIRRPCDNAIIDIHSRAAYDAMNKRVFGTIQDVTEQKRIEADMIESRRRAELASSAKSEFLANMSHEIRTPLNGILGMLQALEDQPLPREQRLMVGCAVRASKRLAELLSDILDLSRIESGAIPITPAAFRLGELVASIEELFAIAASNKGLHLTLAVAPDVPDALVGDASRIRQILFNLVGNAIKFTRHGEITLTVSPLRIEAHRARLLFTVTDTGIGIPEAILPRLCEPFTQARTDTVRSIQGVGLGLSIARKLTALMDGEFTIESGDAGGTAVSFSLPLERPRPQGERAPDAADDDTSAAQQRLRILLAEDDRISAIACRHLLVKMGHAVTTARDGRQALELFAREGFDLVLMDIQMPGLDGLQATQQIRARDKQGDKADTPVIAMTAHAMAGDADRFLAAGMNGYIAKPVEKDVLRDTIARVLRAAATSDAPPAPANKDSVA